MQALQQSTVHDSKNANKTPCAVSMRPKNFEKPKQKKIQHTLTMTSINNDDVRIMTALYPTYEWEFFCKSQKFFWKLGVLLTTSGTLEPEELIFIEFRPRWLKQQKDVYRSLQTQTCSICFCEIFLENIAVQHMCNHPTICKLCFRKLSKCPFCRIPIRASRCFSRLSVPVVRNLLNDFVAVL